MFYYNFHHWIHVKMNALHVAVLTLVAATICLDGAVFAITKAERVKIGEFQFAVWIKKQTNPWKVICGGTLVSSEYVLTLASCVEAGNVGDYVVVVGDRRRHKSGTGETEHTITDVVKFSDVALLKLSPVANTDLVNIETVTLHSENNLLGNEACHLTSFGYRNATTQSRLQMKLKINVLAAGLCGDRPLYTADKTLCFSAKQTVVQNRKHKACTGDGGSAVVCDVEGTYKQVAINTETSCTSALHAARVASDLISWVDSVINASPSPSPSPSPLPSPSPSPTPGRTHDTTIQDHPHHVSVTHRGQHSCSGSVIGDFNILTTARCVQDSMNMYAIQTNNGNRYQDVTTYQVVQITTHPNYNQGLGVYPNDVAVLRVSGRITDSLPEQLVQLADTSDGDFAGRHCFVTGWGSNAQLQEISVEILSHDGCFTSLKENYTGGAHICVDNPAGGCNGDDGGPMVCGTTLVGISSWAPSDCAPDSPSVYARVSSYYSWIMSAMA